MSLSEQLSEIQGLLDQLSEKLSERPASGNTSQQLVHLKTELQAMTTLKALLHSKVDLLCEPPMEQLKEQITFSAQ